MRFLKIVLYVLSFVIFLSACSLRHHSHFSSIEQYDFSEQDFIAHHFQKILFKTQIHAFGKSTSGLLYIKLMDKDHYRFTFLTQMGMKIFDAEIDKHQFKINQLISYLDKKGVRKILENDLRLLISQPASHATKQAVFLNTKEQQSLIREKANGQYYYYLYENQQLVLKEETGSIFKKTSIKYHYQGSGLPESIHIKHFGIKLEWQLIPIKKQLELEE